MERMPIYGPFAKYYEEIYSERPYQKEVEFIESMLQKYDLEGRILDVGCGTGQHVKLLNEKGYYVMGMDASEEMLEIAQENVKNVEFFKGDMKDFTTSETFDTMLCLFTTMHYNKSMKEVEKTLRNFYNALGRKGIVIFDISLTEDVRGGPSLHVHADDTLQIARVGLWRPRGDVMHAKFLFLVKDQEGMDFEVEKHVLGLFNLEQIKEVMEKIGFQVKMYQDFTLEAYSNEAHRPVFIGLKNIKE
ncbi:MAG: class I SAM-dependent methyltransferase [Candidatus Korarchaeota archaeon]|nr:class I SAM-dependent methyltransferase [Candidatus Korarchaeota archaeon]NIU83934.1 methyltransferase domain-containing protein [Candidatus Thorarchaeota archaeon]NIW14062.1 methyltransferase domain-containing protein [Candidatus Thorarchaeota archaeon]NIW52172.1 methyltransferase domain-containing protein [Candidatus Korarchaeota archaeon]